MQEEHDIHNIHNPFLTNNFTPKIRATDKIAITSEITTQNKTEESEVVGLSSIKTFKVIKLLINPKLSLKRS